MTWNRVGSEPVLDKETCGVKIVCCIFFKYQKFKTMGWNLADSFKSVTAACNSSHNESDRRAWRTLQQIEADCALLPRHARVEAFEKKVAMVIRPGQAYHAASLAQLYFADSAARPIGATVQQVLTSLRINCEFRSVSSDGHGVFENGCCLSLPPIAVTAVRVALRLIGVDLRNTTSATLLPVTDEDNNVYKRTRR